MLLDPVPGETYPRIDTRIIRLGTAVTPTDHTHQLAGLADHWTSGITLAGILASLQEPSTDHTLGDAAILLVLLTAQILIDQRHFHLPQPFPGLQEVLGIAPTTDKAGLPVHELHLGFRQLYGLLGLIKLNGMGQLEQREIVIHIGEVELGMLDNLLDTEQLPTASKLRGAQADLQAVCCLATKGGEK